MKKKTKLFKHFITILNILACSVPLIAFAIVTLQDVLPKYFTSLGMQHHGDGSSTFDDDLNALTVSNQFKDMNYHMLNTLDRLDYFNYDITGYRQVQYHTNEVNSNDDLILGNIYAFHLINIDDEEWSANYDFDFLVDTYYYSFYSTNYYIDEFLEPIIFSSMPITINYYGSDNSILIYYGNLENDNYLSLYFDLSTEINSVFYVIFDEQFESLLDTSIYTYFSIADLSLISPIFEEIEGYDNFDDFIDYQNNRSYTDIIQDTDTHLPLNIDFISLFTQSEIINRNGNVAIYLFINYYMNYLINILIILFLPELTIIFFFMLKNLTYKLIDKEI